MERLNVDVLGECPAYFPLEKSLAYVIGENGSGKTHLLETLKKHYESEGQEVLYFSESRYFTLTDWELAKFLLSHKDSDGSYLEKYGINYEIAGRTIRQGMYVSGGLQQIINFFSQIEAADKDIIVLIDEVERNLDIEKQGWLISDIAKLPNVKKIVVATHSPCVIESDWDYCIDATKCVNLYGELVYINKSHLPKLLKKANKVWSEYVKFELEESERRLRWAYVLSEDIIHFITNIKFKSLAFVKQSESTDLDYTVRYMKKDIEFSNNILDEKNSNKLSMFTDEEKELLNEFFGEFNLSNLLETAYEISKNENYN